MYIHFYTHISARFRGPHACKTRFKGGRRNGYFANMKDARHKVARNVD